MKSWLALLMDLKEVKKAKRIPSNKGEEYEYAYRFGGFLTEYIVNRFGKEKYLEFYGATCRDYLYNSDNGQPLIVNGVIQNGVRQRDITRQALKSVGLDPTRVEVEFDRLIKSRTLGKASG